jgi:ankyrin repeat protein
MNKFFYFLVVYFNLFIFSYIQTWAQAPRDSILFNAIIANELELVKKAIEEQKISPNARDRQLGATALMRAIYEDNFEIIEYLLDQGADPKIKGILQISHPHVYDTEIKIGSAIHLAILKGKIGLVRYFMNESNIPADDREFNAQTGREDGLTLLQTACYTPYSDIVDFLLQKGANPNLDNAKAMLISLENNQPEVAKMLIDKGLQIDLLKNQYPLHLACRTTNPDLVNFFLEKGYSINQKHPKTGETPIFSAVLPYTSIEFYELMYQKGADFFLKNADNQSLSDIGKKRELPEDRLYFLINPDKPLHQAIFTKNYKILFEAHQQGKLQTQDRQGKTPLALAQSLENEEFKSESLLYFLQNPNQMKPISIDLQSGSKLVWAVDYDGEKYDFIVNVKNMRPNLIVLWQMTNEERYSGIMTITEKALKYAEWQQNYFGSGDQDILLEDATSIWVSDAVFKSLKAGKITNMAGDREINDLIPRGLNLLPAKINGVYKMLEVITASDAKAEEFYQILNSEANPIILKMRFGWELVIKEINR